MSLPLFRDAATSQDYEAPDYDAIEREQDLVDGGLGPEGERGYRPAKVSDDELERIKEDMRLNRIQITPDTLRHALEAEEIRKVLRRYGIRSLRKVGATRDYQGVVKLTFDEFRKLAERLLQDTIEVSAAEDDGDEQA